VNLVALLFFSPPKIRLIEIVLAVISRVLTCSMLHFIAWCFDRNGGINNE
jgi:hypothetical protein